MKIRSLCYELYGKQPRMMNPEPLNLESVILTFSTTDLIYSLLYRTNYHGNQKGGGTNGQLFRSLTMLFDGKKETDGRT